MYAVRFFKFSKKSENPIEVRKIGRTQTIQEANAIIDLDSQETGYCEDLDFETPEWMAFYDVVDEDFTEDCKRINVADPNVGIDIEQIGIPF